MYLLSVRKRIARNFGKLLHISYTGRSRTIIIAFATKVRAGRTSLRNLGCFRSGSGVYQPHIRWVPGRKSAEE